ncbi:two pore domain potassium channel family protein [Halopseudomonas nanhaiensis]|uniref:ion channel n=1 Tax=Halopseudomonas nanhaiensis TaxID=2830842 RepID=UPI001CBD5B89|nr:ion channel [Halopseudomonas nanhaiensis]UAW97691.1 two pore domain potassium channel family protein [Halopseudomonas nanhaiensis]
MTSTYLVVALATALITIAAIVFHYEVAYRLGAITRWSGLRPRLRILLLFFGLLIAHVIEIWMFGVGAWLLAEFGQNSGISEMQQPGLLDFVYLSAATYTTVGYGDLSPGGHLRFLFGTEALAGLMLITWSASLTFVEMQNHWRDE